MCGCLVGRQGSGDALFVWSVKRGPFVCQVLDHPDLGCILGLPRNSSCDGMVTFEHLILNFYSELATSPLTGHIPKQYSSRAWNKVAFEGVIAAGSELHWVSSPQRWTNYLVETVSSCTCKHLFFISGKGSIMLSVCNIIGWLVTVMPRANHHHIRLPAYRVINDTS